MWTKQKCKRTKVDTSIVVLLLLRNLLVCLEPMYGATEWALNYGRELTSADCQKAMLAIEDGLLW